MMTKSNYLIQANGKKIDVDGVPKNQPYQCVDLIKDYMKRCYGIPYFSIHNDAKNYYEMYEDFPYLVKYFTRIKNTPSLVPKKGDIVVWNGTKGNGHGHVAVSTGIGDTKTFYSLDQNWEGPYATKVKHDYKGVLGVLRPKYGCTTANLNVRSGPGTEYRIVDTLDKGTLVRLLKLKNNWEQIGEDRWCSAKYLD